MWRELKRVLGVNYVSPEIHMATLGERGLRRRTETYLTLLRGMTAPAFLVHPAGADYRGARSGVGGDFGRQIGGGENGACPTSALALGKTLWFDGQEWKICADALRLRGRC